VATTIAELQGILTLDDSQFKSGLEGARGGMSSLGAGIQSAGQRMTRFGIGASLALAPVTLFLRSSIGAFREFDVAMTNSQTILGATNEEMEILSDQVLDIGRHTGLGPQAVAEAFFTVVSGVQDATTHMDILQASVTLAEAGLADLAVTTDGMVAVMNSYQFAAEDASFVSDVFTRTVQMGVGTMDEFVSALSPLASLAHTLNISFEELAGAEALLTSQGRSASEAATQLQAVMTAFIKPNTDMTAALEAMGFTSGQAAIETLGLQGAVDALSTALHDDVGAMADALGRVHALNGALVLAGDGAGEFLDSFEGGVDGAAAAAAELQNATDAAIGDAFTAKLDTLKIIIGEQLSGAIADVQTVLTPLLDDLISWSQENPELVKQIILFTGALIGLAAALVIVGGFVSVFGGAIGLLLSPIGLAVAAGVLLGITIYELGKALGIDWQALGRGIMDFFIGLGKIFHDVVVEIAQLLGLMEKTPEPRAWTREEEALFLSDPMALSPSAISNLGLTPAVGKGYAEGGEFEAMQTIRVGERGPETVRFSQGGTVIPNGQSAGDKYNIVIYANDEAGGRAAARGFAAELDMILVRNG
jgi:TP901 family phage tail tape measure protein